MNVKRMYDDSPIRVDGGVRAVEDAGTGSLIVYDSKGDVIARFTKVIEYWPEASPAENIERQVPRVEQSLGPDVIRIRYSIGTDWNDDPAVYFRVILSDDAAEHRLHEVAERIRERLDFESMGLRTYHHFRSESEQASLKDADWA